MELEIAAIVQYEIRKMFKILNLVVSTVFIDGSASISADCWHYCDIIMSAMASQITSPAIVYSTSYSVADQRKPESSASLAFVRRIHRWLVNSPHRGTVTRKMFPFDDVIMGTSTDNVDMQRDPAYTFEELRCLLCFMEVTAYYFHFINQGSFWLWAPTMGNCYNVTSSLLGWDHTGNGPYKWTIICLSPNPIPRYMFIKVHTFCCIANEE